MSSNQPALISVALGSTLEPLSTHIAYILMLEADVATESTSSYNENSSMPFCVIEPIVAIVAAALDVGLCCRTFDE